MRTWQRALTDTLCGGCGEPIRKGDPMQTITLQAQLVDRDGNVGTAIDVKDRKLRCARCADGPVPEIPVVTQTRVEFVSQPKPRKSSMAGIGALATDWKLKQAGR